MPADSTEFSNGLISFLEGVAARLPIIGICLLSLVGLYFLMKGVARLLDYWYQMKRKTVFLEVTQPVFGDRSSDANMRFMSMLHGIRGNRSWLDKLLFRSAVFTSEIVSEEDKGVRYVLQVSARDRYEIEQALASQMPAAKIRQVDNYISRDIVDKHVRVMEFRQKGHYAFPLLDQGKLEYHDSMAQITGALAGPRRGEIVGYQLVIVPVSLRAADVLRSRISNNPEEVNSLGRTKLPVLGTLMNAIHYVLFGALELIGDAVTSGAGRGRGRKNEHDRPNQEASSETKTTSELVKAKLAQPLFRVNIRLLTVSSSKEACLRREKNMKLALGVFKTSNQAIVAKIHVRLGFVDRYRLFMFQHRLPSLFASNSTILSASEWSDLYHFPHSETTNTDNMSKSLSKTLAAPVSLKGDAKLDVIIGRNTHHGVETAIGLTAAERELHTFIIGATGNGKSTLMKYAIVQDIRNGKGVAVVDPHGDLATDLLGYIPEDRLNDVVYFNPADLKFPINYNWLDLPAGMDDDELLLEQNRKAEAVMSIFRKVFSDNDSGGHRIEELLRNCIETAWTIEGATIFTVLKLLRNRDYRKKIVAGLEDQDLKDYWRQELGSAGEMQRVSITKGLTVKIDRFKRSPGARRVLEQPKSTINFDDIMNSGKILICNFSNGTLGDITSSLFGTMVLAELKMAAERRAMVPESERRPFYLYVDEFQNFATSSFVKMLSGSRKYKLFLTIAEQSTSQQEDQRMVESILGNVSTLICFKTGSPADEDLLVRRLSPYIEQGEISNLPRYNFYARMSGIVPQQPVSGVTLVLEPGDREMTRKVIDASRKNYGRRYQVSVERTKQPKVEAMQPTNSVGQTEDYPDDDPTIA